MIRSLHIIGSRQFGGAEHFFLRLVQALNEKGHPAWTVTRPGSPVYRSLPDSPGRLEAAMRNGWDLFSALKIRGLIRKAEAQIVQSYMGRATRLTRLPKGSRAIHVARLGGFYKIEGYYRHADAWVGNTRELCDYLVRQKLPISRVFRIGNFVDIPPQASPADRDGQRQSLGIPGDALVVFSLGRFIAKKGFGDLLEAFSQLPREIHGRPVFLAVAGDGPLRQTLENRGRDLGLDSRLRWLGWQNHPTPYFHMADLFVCPSREEPLGNVILESWAHRLPVVSTCTSGALELIQDGVNGLLCPLHDPGGLAGRLFELLRAEGSAARDLTQSGWGALMASHSKEAVLGKYIAMYEELLG